MKGLSIVIPCYNSRQFILRCLKSLESTLIDVEVIIVEDCSEASSEDLVVEYAKKTNISIKYLKNEKNLGPGNTRNRGIVEASKEYITFLDSDDEFSQDYFEQVLPAMEKEYDMIVYDAVRVFKEKKFSMNMFFSNLMPEGTLDPKECLVYIMGCTCGKMYRTDIVKKNNIRFGDLKKNEDMIFTKIATAFMNSVYYVKKDLYIYHNVESSLTNNVSVLSPQNNIKGFQIVANRLHDLNYEDELNSIFFIEVLFSTTNSLIQLQKSNSEIISNYKYFRKMYHDCDKYREKYMFSMKFAYFLFEHNLFGIYNFLRSLYKKIR